MRRVERARAVDANYRSCLAFFRVYTRASVPSTPTRIAGSICPETPEWSKDGRPRFYRLPTSTTRRRQPTALAGSPKIPTSYRGRRMHPEETKVHRRGLVLAPGLAANRAYTKKQRDRAAQQRNELASSYVGHG